MLRAPREAPPRAHVCVRVVLRVRVVSQGGGGGTGDELGSSRADTGSREGEARPGGDVSGAEGDTGRRTA